MIDLSDPRLQRVIEALKAGRRFLVATHIRPDGDAAGSVLAMAAMLRAMGKEADPFCQDPPPAGYDFLAGIDGLHRDEPVEGRYDTAVLVDCGDIERVGPMLAEAVRRIPFIVNIDHHLSNTPFGHVDWVESSAGSTCEMLYELCGAIPVPVDADIATQLYTGILTDTGSFRFSNTNGRVLEIASRLADAGASPSFIAEKIYDSGSPRRLLLLGMVLASASFLAEGRLVTAELTLEMFERSGALPEDSDGFINHLRGVKSVDMAVLFREGDDDAVHVSMRAKGRVDVSVFAAARGGGGHRNAAAFRVAGRAEAVRPAVTREMLEYLA